jgi:DNA-binding IclR family transcriptional regulator
VLLPVMRALNQALGEAIAFHIPDGDRRICLYRVNATFAIGHQIREGAVQDMERGAGGRVLLAFLGRAGEPYDEIRRHYFYLSLGERDPEVAGISAPVFGARQALVGALGIVGPITRVDHAFMIRERGRLLEAAATATAALGGDPLPLRRAQDLG